MKLLIAAVVAMLFQQALSTMSALTVPVLAPAIIAELGFEPRLIGRFTFVVYLCAMISSLLSGSVILRYGAMRTSQVCMVFFATGLLVASPGTLWLFIAAAVLIGLGGGPSTPASSHLIARHSPAAYAPLFFSIKQTGVPLGAGAAGVLIPFYLGLFGWRGAIVAAAVMTFAFILVLQPLRARLDSDRTPGRKWSLGDLRATYSGIKGDPYLRELTMASFVFTGVQLIFFAYFVTYLTQGLGYSISSAGLLLAISQGAAMVARVFWGWVGSTLVPPRLLLGVLGIAMAVISAIIGAFTPDWPVILVGAVAVSFGLTASGYQGLLLAETARVAPIGMAGVITGGVAFAAYSGMMVFPVLYGETLGATGSYAYGFYAIAVATAAVAVLFFKPAAP